MTLPGVHELQKIRSHKEYGPDRFSRFDDYRLQTDKQRKYIEVVL